jgi:hypothetical protein
MEDLPVELLERVAFYSGWSGYGALRLVNHGMRACLPWKKAVNETSHPNQVMMIAKLAKKDWDSIWFLRNMTLDCYVKGLWVLDGFHGDIFFLGDDKKTVVGTGHCYKGRLEGLVTLRSSWRGGMSFIELFREGHPHRELPRTAI